MEKALQVITGIFQFDLIQKFSVYLRLVKCRLVLLVLVSAAAGFVLGASGPVRPELMVAVLAGTSLLASGALALNQWMEHKFDAQMVRTAGRPIPAGELSQKSALSFGLGLMAAGAWILFQFSNAVCMVLGLATVVLYLGFYTPMKRWTPWCVYAGAVSGALPPVMGWAAVTSPWTAGAGVLFAVLFFWQLLHFGIIAWVFRKDYRNAGFVFAEIEDTTGLRTARTALIWAVVLTLTSLLPTLIRLAGAIYLTVALGLGACLIFAHVRALDDMASRARSLMFTSIFYLFILLAAMSLDKV